MMYCDAIYEKIEQPYNVHYDMFDESKLVEQWISSYNCNISSETTDELQKQIDELPNNSTLTLKKDYEYIIDKPLKLKSNMKIDGNNATIKWKDNTKLQEEYSDGVGILNLGENLKNVKIENLNLDGNTRNNPWVTTHTYETTSKNGMDGIRGRCGNLYITNVKLKDIQKMGIDINGTKSNVILDEVEVNKSQRDGIFCVGNKVIIKNSKVINAHDNGIAVDTNYLKHGGKINDVRIVNCSVENNLQISNGCGIFIGGSKDEYPSNILIDKCTVKGCTYHGIIGKYVDNLSIIDCDISDCENKSTLSSHGVMLVDTTNSNIFDSNILNNQSTGVYIRNNENLKIQANICKNKYTGILVDDNNKNVTISKCEIYDNGKGLIKDRKSSGIIVNDSDKVKIINSKFKNTDTENQCYAVVFNNDEYDFTLSNLYRNQFYNLKKGIYLGKNKSPNE